MMQTFKVWCPEFGANEKDARHLHAFDAANAAMIWAKLEQCQGEKCVVCVKLDDIVETYLVLGSKATVYSATKSIGYPSDLVDKLVRERLVEHVFVRELATRCNVEFETMVSHIKEILN